MFSVLVFQDLFPVCGVVIREGKVKFRAVNRRVGKGPLARYYLAAKEQSYGRGGPGIFPLFGLVDRACGLLLLRDLDRVGRLYDVSLVANAVGVARHTRSRGFLPAVVLPGCVRRLLLVRRLLRLY